MDMVGLPMNRVVRMAGYSPALMVGLVMACPSVHGAWIFKYTPAGAVRADTPLRRRPCSSSAGTGISAASSCSHKKGKVEKVKHERSNLNTWLSSNDLLLQNHCGL